MTLQRECPLCGSVRARPVWHEQGFHYVICSVCGIVFSNVDAETYEASGRNMWHDDELATSTESFYGTARELVHARFLARFPPVGRGRLLDVGCGLGFFVNRALSSGWDAYGCDTSPAWVRVARERAGHGRIALGGVTDHVLGGRFDLITAWDVLEHIHDPLAFLRSIHAVLAPGGRLFIRTPNLTWVYPTYAIRRHLLSAEVELGPLNHVVYYTAATLRRALESVGLRAIEWPVLPPPQVGLANRDPSQAGHKSAVTRIKNAHASLAHTVAQASRGLIVVGADLDVVAMSAQRIHAAVASPEPRSRRSRMFRWRRV